VPADDRVRESINSGVPYVLKYSDTVVTKQIFRLASTLAGVDLYPKKGGRSFFSFFKRREGSE
jgi:MinD-like ATPase involved in chromosome partitioning or flagellar assembly